MLAAAGLLFLSVLSNVLYNKGGDGYRQIN
jgi:hypothetical protein